MAEVVVLGSGTSNGVPMVGMDYRPEFLANPKNHRSRAAIAVLGPTGNLLVDCPPELRLQLTCANIKRVEATLITHTHADHIMGMDDLRSICLLTGTAMPVYTTPQYQEDIRRVFNYAFREFPPGVDVPRFDLFTVEENLSVGGLEFRIFQVWHGKTPVLGLRVNNFAYITDVSEIPEDVYPLLEGLDTLILDAVRLRPHPNHFHYERALQEAEKIGAKMTYFTHLSHDYDHDVTEANMPPNVRLCYDGQRIQI
ncbi:MAG: MBL fold metallo-hydrolase [Armatimonadetes bacterium]|nr:MBL fold metallo-hydrolase [Armatimonadota bacterium]